MPTNQRRVRIKDSNGDASPPRHYQGRQTMGGHTLFLRYEKKIAQVKHLRHRYLWQFHYQLIRGHCNLLPISKEIVYLCTKNCRYAACFVLNLSNSCYFQSSTPHQSLKLLLSGKLQNRTKTPKGVSKLKCPAKLQRAQHLTHESHLRHSSYRSYHEIDSLHTVYSDI